MESELVYDRPQPSRTPQFTVSSFGSPPSSLTPGYGRHRKNAASIEEMMPIDETRVFNLAEERTQYHQQLSVTEPETYRPSSPSLLRQLSTKLLSPNLGSKLRPLSRTQGHEYANLRESEADLVEVDLSSLGGLGFQLEERRSPSPGHIAYQDNTYHGSKGQVEETRSEVEQKQDGLGSGLVIGAQLKRDPSTVVRRSSTTSGLSVGKQIQRNETVREIGQNLAEKRKVIVAVSEAVDLSSMEGPSMGIRPSQTFDTMEVTRTDTSKDGPQSYFFPTDPDVPNWRPFSMRPLYISTLILIALGLAGFQEYLCQLSSSYVKQDPPRGILTFDSVSEVSVWNFFAWKYLPTMITIAYAVLFSIMDFDIRRLEPYYQLSQPQGSPASASLNLDYLTMFQYFVPLNAIRLRQWAVLASTVANIIAATVAPALQNPSINFQTNNQCTSVCPPGQHMYMVTIQPVWSRLLSGSYVIVAALATVLAIQLRRKSGLLSDPKGIAGIASMATKSHILQDFKGLDLATRGTIHKRLARRRYVLYKSSIWQGKLSETKEETKESESRLQSPHPIMLRLIAGVPFILILIGFLAAIPIISLTSARVIPNAVPWLPILVATVIKLLWSTFEADVRLIEPFYRLSKGNAKPENSLTLDYQATIYGWMPISAAMKGHYLVALVGLASVCLDILSVTVSSFSVDSQVFLAIHPSGQNDANQDETYVSFWASEILSTSILIFVIGVAIAVYARRRHPFLPREPSTIAAVLSFIYSSKMLDDFIGTERLDNRAMEARLKSLGKTYGLGWFVGRDRKPHCAIDEEPMTSRYVHGKPYSSAVAGPMHDHVLEFMP